ncbi:hypothetical protein D869_gp131 [Caulobacter phage CcrRogue]|uniref:Uncharacterized protein n=1 Tax=Caulobacter phage CcrRogue TaxID=2927986 RepID=K4JSQ3_9CAUD|nr:hypothetical protein D869_gp131 [Caulobacter phage CcrRogue]AFU86783.1 hypothetical protein CcrRogue_gp301 [Caulobacter phage CcrRogue]
MIWQGRALRVSFGDNLVAELTKLRVPPSTFGLSETPSKDQPHMKLYDVWDVMGERQFRDLGVPANPQYGRDVSGMWTNGDMWITPQEAAQIIEQRKQS